MAATREELMAFFDELGIETSTVEHKAVFTVAESDEVLDHLPGGHTKNLFLKDKKGNLFLIVAEQSARIDLKAVGPLIGASGRVSFGKPELLMEVLGVEPGSVTPFSLINDRGNQRVSVIFDAHMMGHELLNYHPLKNTATTSIKAEDLMKFARACGHEPRILKVSEQSQDIE
ncbi:MULTISPECIES: prolyl-tRNA synthetase associated domain-containing protein [Pseudovibrio]|uniref:prolyl-tRNA synthetase associated domain-containing protein n=1 Tax=Stappiaceae TaxID=2821832 RepID=UPI002366379C|nr:MULTISPECIES: prolyl-tRNA synthetase associated domain-containing protein [Pseudovibrio]MDD7909366.1 prolyl-tRNA synthetase associated domain-containing protein [Pseudovibrio exalbescens]MDX5594925.1 prolyl-tRNA synthetase associated domain-containing protein [Pseudovibrio sp. SPO723]